MIRQVERQVALRDIAGRSPLNPRTSEPPDVESIAASILAEGLLFPLLVESVCNPQEHFYTLDGERRRMALLLLADQGHIAADAEIKVVEIQGSEADKRAVALAAAVQRRDLHPVEVFEAYADLARAGMNEAEIAKSFNISPRDVKKHLSRAKIAPEIRADWKAGEIAADVAESFAECDSHARQREVYDALKQSRALYPQKIRERLRGDAVDATEGIAIFAEADYVAAGGAIDDSLFEEASYFRDGQLLRDCAVKKLARDGEALRSAEGWAWVLPCEASPKFDRAFVVKGAPDYTDAERKALAEIEDDLAGASSEEAQPLYERIDAIDAKAWSRGVSKTQRKSLGVAVWIDDDGRLAIARALDHRQEPQVQPASSEDRERSAHAGASAKTSAPAEQNDIEQPGKKLRAILDDAIGNAFADCVRGNVNAAFALFVATMGCASGASALDFWTTGGQREIAHDLLARIEDMAFADAMAVCAAADLADLTTAFCVLVARAITLHAPNVGDYGVIARALAGISAIGPALDRALDRDLYFAAATKEAGLSAIGELLGEAAAAEASKLSREKIADAAARAARDRRWLPFPLSSWAVIAPARAPADAAGAPAQSLADAMGAALDADADAVLVQRFLDQRTTRGDALSVRASDLHAAFVRWAGEGALDAPNAVQFGHITGRLGLRKHRTKRGQIYLGLALHADAPALAEAAG